MRNRIGIIFALGLALEAALGTVLPTETAAAVAPWHPAEVTATEIAVKANDTADPATRRAAAAIGRSWRLDSGEIEFGGFSGAAWHGRRLYLVSDRGTLWRAEAELGDDGGLVGLRDWQWATVQDPGRRRRLDLEALAAAPDGRLFTVVEGRHRIYEIVNRDGELLIAPLPLPEVLSPSPSNRGIEALGTGDGASFVAISEGLTRPGGGHAGVVVSAAGEPVPFAYHTATGFDPTDVSVVPDGRIFVLERRYGLLSGWQARIGELTPGEGESAQRTLVTLGAGLALDNFEGLAVRQEGGRTRAVIVSDDNYLFVQSTLLFELELP